MHAKVLKVRLVEFQNWQDVHLLQTCDALLVHNGSHMPHTLGQVEMLRWVGLALHMDTHTGVVAGGQLASRLPGLGALG